MATLGDIANTVALEILTRSDAKNDFVLKCAKRAYLTVCGKVPFHELRELSGELNLAAGTDLYDLSTLVDYEINNLFSIRLSSSQNSRRLKRVDPMVYDSYTTVPEGTPSTYARSDKKRIQLNPTPNSSTDTIRIRYWKKPTIEDDVESTTLEIPEEWEELVEMETLYRAYHYLQEPMKASMLVQPNPVPMPGSSNKRMSKEVGAIPRLWNDLLSIGDWREQGEWDFSIQPLIRAYTPGGGR